MSEQTGRYALIAIAPCGCVSAICKDDNARYSAEFTREQLLDGNVVQRLAADEARRRFVVSGIDCPHEPKWGKSEATR